MVAAPDVTRLTPDSPHYPAGLRRFLADRAPAVITARGNLEILRTPTLALFCSTCCPGNLILQTYDLARTLRDGPLTVISGFHTPMEKECLRLLLRGKSALIICPARSIDRYRLPTDWRTPLTAGRLLLVSPFTAKHKRPTADLALIRNEFVACLAEQILIPHAARGSKTEMFVRSLISQGKRVVTLNGDLNGPLVELGARAIVPADFASICHNAGKEPSDSI